MKIIKGLIGFALFAVGTLFLGAYILASAGVNVNSRGVVIFLLFLSVGVGRLGYSISTGHISLPNFSKILNKENKEKLKNILYKKK